MPMASTPLPPSVGLLMLLAFAWVALTLFLVMGTQYNGDYIDEHQGRGSVEDNWGLNAFEDVEADHT
jgi:hypothetical protein